METPLEFKPCPGGGWRDHVIELITLLKPVLTDEMEPTERVIYIDNLYEELCDWHLTALLFLSLGFFNGNNVTHNDLFGAAAALMQRDEATIGRPHP
jgi:hypothetical protein